VKRLPKGVESLLELSVVCILMGPEEFFNLCEVLSRF